MFDMLDARSGVRFSQPRPRWLVVAVVVIVVMLSSGCGVMPMRMDSATEALDLATTRSSTNDLYRVQYTPDVMPVPVNQLHTWTIQVATADGRPVEGATIMVDGDMPQHMHGLPTAPQVTQELGDGAYLVEGLRFHMPGWWVVDYTISADNQTDTVRFNLQLP